MKFLLLSNNDVRADLFCNAASKSACSVSKLSYVDITRDFSLLESESRNADLIRIESPGLDFELEKLILALGEGIEGDFPRISNQALKNCSYDKGRVLFPGQWFAGFKVLMEKIDSHCSNANARFFNAPSNIVQVFDKPACNEFLSRKGICVPQRWTGISSYDDFMSLPSKQNPHFFIKLRSGSSASGVCAFRNNISHGKQLMYSTVVHSGGKFYNSLKIRKYTSMSEIKPIIDFILNEGGFAEQWIPKAAHQGKSFDVRAVVVNNRLTHTIARLSRSPMTNLHLGNSRDNAVNVLGREQMSALKKVAEDASMYFSRLFYAGYDVLFHSQSGIPYIVEVNAFGDLINNAFYKGMSTYECEVEEMKRAFRFLQTEA